MVKTESSAICTSDTKADGDSQGLDWHDFLRVRRNDDDVVRGSLRLRLDKANANAHGLDAHDEVLLCLLTMKYCRLDAHR